MKSWNARAGAVPPCRPATVRASSRPIHTPVVSPLEKPMNQPSLFELVVPVLPATGRPICAARPVPVQHRRLQQVGHFRRDPRRDQHALFVALAAVELAAVGGDRPCGSHKA